MLRSFTLPYFDENGPQRTETTPQNNHTHAHLHIRTARIYMNAHTQHTCMYSMHTHMHIRAHTHTCKHRRIYIQTCAHIYTHTWDCGEKYQSPQLCRWHHPYGRKQRGTKEPLDEGERGEWKSWLKAQHSENQDHGIWSHHFMANGWRNNVKSERIYFWGSKITADCECSHEIKTLAPWKESYDPPRQHIKKQRHYFANKGMSSQSYGFFE